MSIKPKILLQVCCAPDATVAAERLRAEYTVGVYFYNPNIHPGEEYDKRVQELARLAPQIGAENYSAPYDPERWFEAVKGYEHEPEKGVRCHICFRLRLEATAGAAKELGFDLYGTVLTVSPHKDAELINRLGREIGTRYGVEYFESNFKKKDGFKRSLELSKQFGLYRQDYCGCVFSRLEREQTNRGDHERSAVL
jgi:predicted adenine nucleotide alpha hydrolase (AANH) superfamily ATPase